MESSLADQLGISPELFHYLILPLLIFVARIGDVSINTLRIIYMLHGKKWISTILGFFESLIWIIAISQIFQNVDSIITYFAYAGGFACGIYVGMIIEDKLAIGRVVVRVIEPSVNSDLVEYLDANGYRYSNMLGKSKEGDVNILFTVIKRENLKATIGIIKKFNPGSYYTVEGVKRVSDEDISDEKGFSFRRLIVRK
jgi:uncharacterized protein YebE (UPF0316 family)